MMTFPQKRLEELGLTSVQVARRMARGQRLGQRQLESRAATVQRVLRRGQCGRMYALRLSSILAIEASWLELPSICWPASWQAEGTQVLNAAETPESPQGVSNAVNEVEAKALASGERACGNERARHSHSPRAHPQRMQILHLVP